MSTTAAYRDPAESALRRQRLAYALRGLVIDLADERAHVQRLNRENAVLRRERDELLARLAAFETSTA